MLNTRYYVHIHPDAEALSQAGARYWLKQAQQAIAQRGVFHVALTGGSTPHALYRLLATPSFAEHIDWSRVHIFMGDERYVPEDDPQSNFGMARDCLLRHIPIPAQNLHPVPTHYTQAGEAAARYEVLIKSLLPSVAQRPVFDLIMLGMGEDGHTASLFPGTDILQESAKDVAAVYVDKLASWRVSMTYPLLNQARQVMVLVTGGGKAAILAHVLRKDSETIYPIQSVVPAGDMHWFIDQAAASMLDQSSS